MSGEPGQEEAANTYAITCGADLAEGKVTLSLMDRTSFATAKIEPDLALAVASNLIEMARKARGA